MCKLILSMDGVVLSEFDFGDKKIVRIGRNAKNEVRIDNRSISAEHALIVHDPNGRHFIEDLDSTNGTTLNGKKVTRHPLRANDVIGFGKYYLKFLEDDPFDQKTLTSDGIAFEKPDMSGIRTSAPASRSIYKTLNPNPSSSSNAFTQTAPIETTPKLARMRFVQGNVVGKEIPIEKEVLRIGRNQDVARIVRQNNDYFLYYEQGSPPKINGVETPQPQLLQHNDRIALGGIEIDFLYN